MSKNSIPPHVIFLLLMLFALTGCFHTSSENGSGSEDNQDNNEITLTSPVFTSGTTISVAENTTVTGYTAIATDADGDTVIFSLTGGVDQAAFSIDDNSGVLSFKTAMDFETPIDDDTNNTYVVDITATDGTHFVVQSLTVTVTDINEPTSPVFTSDTAISVSENNTVTGYTAMATDADGDTVIFSLTGGVDQTAFSIDDNSGVLSFKTAMDFETPTDDDTNNTYVVDITATDGTNFVVQSLTVTVTDIDENADPVGYYINTGTASVDNGMSGTIDINDLQAMVTGNRIMMMSVANELLYDGTITSISGDSFTADFTIYTAGKDPVTATASGTITKGAKIEGTLTGSGVGSGTFSLLYASTNNQAAAMTLAWRGSGGGFDEFGFTIDGAENLVHDKTSDVSPFDTCKMNGTVTPVSGTRLYSVDVELTGCNDPQVNGVYTGLATTRDESVMDDRLVYAVSNDVYTLNGEFNPD